jgi:hypothetical protein
MVDGRPLEVALSVDGVAPLLAGEVRPAAAALSWTGGQATFEGRLSLTPALDGHGRSRRPISARLLRLRVRRCPSFRPAPGATGSRRTARSP